MPRDFFKHLAVFTILKRREFPESQLLPKRVTADRFIEFGVIVVQGNRGPNRLLELKVLEAGIVGSLDYKIIEAGRADDLYAWLKANKYHYSGDEATLNFYVQKKWLFTVMKIDTLQMKKNKDGTYAGEVTPTRFQFRSEQFVYPLRITQLSVKDKTEALFYVQAPFKTDLQGNLSYQHHWVPMLQAASGCTPGGLPGRGADWLTAIDEQLPAFLRRTGELGFKFVPGQRPKPNQQGQTPTTLEWARRLTEADIKVLKGDAPYSEKVPDVDEGFTRADLKDPKRAEAIYKVIRGRLEKSKKDRPLGYLVRHAPAEDVRQLALLLGHVRPGLFIVKFRRVFTRAEMNDDLILGPARLGNVEDFSEYEEILPTSPP
jgi:hypothetical protein